jgi:hypothetical protein
MGTDTKTYTQQGIEAASYGATGTVASDPVNEDRETVRDYGGKMLLADLLIFRDTC